MDELREMLTAIEDVRYKLNQVTLTDDIEAQKSLLIKLAHLTVKLEGLKELKVG